MGHATILSAKVYSQILYGASMIFMVGSGQETQRVVDLKLL